MPAETEPKEPLQHFLREHLEARKLDQVDLARQLRRTEMTVSRWVLYKVKLKPTTLKAIAEALMELQPEAGHLEWDDLLRAPDKPSANQLLRLLPEEDQRHFMRQLENAVRVQKGDI